MHAAYDAAVWDLGGVLVDWDPRYLYRTLLPDDSAVEEFLDEVDFAGWNAQQDAGRSHAEGLAAHGARFPHRRELLAAYVARFPETLGGDLPGSVDLLAQQRRRGVRLLALTNWSAETFGYATARFEWLRWFEAVVVSGEEGVAKPDPRIFQLLAERHRIEPARTFYVDDNALNVAAAAGLGFDAVLFTSASTLRVELTSRGLA